MIQASLVENSNATSNATERRFADLFRLAHVGPRTALKVTPIAISPAGLARPSSDSRSDSLLGNCMLLDFRLHKARSSPRRSPGLAKSPALPVAKSPRIPVTKKPKGTSILPETPIATRTALPGIDADDRERGKKQKPKCTTAKSPNDKTEVDDPEIKASAPSLRSPHRSGSG